VKHELSISNQTIVDWYNYCREVCVSILEKVSELIGGQGVVVEIDESKFGKRKYHKGRHVERQWVFGGIARESKRCFFATVDDRSQRTLLQIIKDNIKPGTTIISDYWKAYQCLDQEGFEHLKVNHSLNFVDPDSGAHTNTIESTWRALKKSLPKYGTVKPLHDTYFSQYCVKKKYIHGSEDPFLEFLKLIKRIYNPETRKQKLISEEISIEIHISKIKKPRILQDITNTNSPSITLNSSLDDYM
jgi:transposase-like protein